MMRLTDRPATLVHGEYTATINREERTPWGIETRWAITRHGALVGSMLQGSAGYGERPVCSMSRLVHDGPVPRGCSSPKDPNYGICFDPGPCDTRELALAEFARRADRLIAWRAENAGNPEVAETRRKLVLELELTGSQAAIDAYELAVRTLLETEALQEVLQDEVDEQRAENVRDGQAVPPDVAKVAGATCRQEGSTT